jgi:exopolyphosphatase / guanosine-5'-triphosphate,3'-diphosphate pyrophosphatase
MRIGVVDIGTNSTRLLVADVVDGVVEEVERLTTVTRLGQGVDASGALAEEAMERVFATLTRYRERIDAHDCEATVGVLTSAVRDATNGTEFTQVVRDRFGLDAHTISGDEEARLTYLGATSEGPPEVPVAVVDIGGGSTEVVLGEGTEVPFHVSAQAGVVRMTERHLHDDPPRHEQLEALADDVREVLAAAVPPDVRDAVQGAIAVAGTATSCAAIAQQLDPYDPERVHGYMLELGTCERMLAELAQMPLADRREVKGLHPDRAPTIVAGVVILIEALRLLGLEATKVSERDILHGAALDRAAAKGEKQ